MEDNIFDKVHEVDLKKTMETSYIDYAMSVIASRALPDVRDGLKPVQRRILRRPGKYGAGMVYQISFGGRTRKLRVCRWRRRRRHALYRGKTQQDFHGADGRHQQKYGGFCTKL